MEMEDIKNISISDEINDIDWDSTFDSMTMSPEKSIKGVKNAECAGVNPENIKNLFVESQYRYIVVGRLSTPQDTFTVFEISSEKDNTGGRLELHDCWHQELTLEQGMLINIVDVQPNCFTNTFVVSRQCGFVVVEPDTLLSITSIMSQMWCPRKSALSEIFKAPIQSLDALRGTIAHDIIGRAMMDRVSDSFSLNTLVRKCLSETAVMNSAYGCKLTQAELNKLALELLPFIKDFVENRFFKRGKDQKFDFVSICDIEDTYWNPIFGLKGKLDATVKIKYEGDQEKIVPFEFKTGNGKYAGKNMVRAEHTGQVSLYTLLIRPRYGIGNSGLLLYIREKFLKDCQVPLLELQHLICMRNRLVVGSSSTNGLLNFPRPGNIDYTFKCDRCELQQTCAAMLRQSSINAAPFQTDAEQKLAAAASHLEPEDITFFQRWLKIITLEIEDHTSIENVKSLWKTKTEIREQKGNCISNLEFLNMSPTEILDSNGNRCFLLSLTKSEWGNNRSKTLLMERDMITVSTQFELCLSYGTIQTMTESSITVTIERKLNELSCQPHVRFTIDKIMSNSVLQMQYSYLSKLMDSSPESLRIRNYIIRKSPSKFVKIKSTDPDLLLAQPILARYNNNQQKVLLKCLETDSFLFVKGMPGTGKTETIVGLLQILTKRNYKVLLVAYTNNAVDNILLKYKEYSQDFVRIGTASKLCGGDLKSFSTAEIAKNVKNIDELTSIYNNRAVVGSTLMSLKHEIFRQRTFDYCVIDEASQALPPTVLGAMVLSKKYILFGDPDQLPAIIKSTRVKEMKIEDSMFKLAAQPMNTIKLSIQYRMNSVIMGLANKLVYKDQMTCGGEVQSESFLELPTHVLKNYVFHQPKKSQPWLSSVLSKKLIKSVVFLDTSLLNVMEERIGESIRNPHEAQIVRFCVQSFVECGCKGKDVGIICPFRGQVAYVKQILNELGSDEYGSVEVNTVDQYQGRDKDIIICSFTKSKMYNGSHAPAKDNLAESSESKQSILEDIRRLNVAVTRAKKKLIMIGNRLTLEGFAPFQKLFSSLEKEQVISFSDENTKDILVVKQNNCDVIR